jgi:hypothetical protein
MPKSRLNERSSEGQVALPNHWLRECEMRKAYSTYNQVTMPARQYPVSRVEAEMAPEAPWIFPCTQYGFTTGRLRNSADVYAPNRCLQWSEVGV